MAPGAHCARRHVSHGASIAAKGTLSQRGAGTVRPVDPAKDIADFLTSRRAKVTPEQVGLPTYGPRREEVGSLAGVQPVPTDH